MDQTQRDNAIDFAVEATMFVAAGFLVTAGRNAQTERDVIKNRIIWALESGQLSFPVAEVKLLAPPAALPGAIDEAREIDPDVFKDLNY